MLYRGRIDAVEGITETVMLAWLSTNTTEFVLVHHILPQMPGIKEETGEPYPDTTNPHYHFYANAPRFKTPQAIGYHLKKLSPNLTKSDWSVKPCDPLRIDEYLQYLFNEKFNNKWTLIRSYKDLATIQARAAAIAADFKERHKDDNKQVSGYQISLELVEYMKQQDWTESAEYGKITQHAIKLHNKYRKAFCLFSLERVVVTAIGIATPGRVADSVARSIARKFDVAFFPHE